MKSAPLLALLAVLTFDSAAIKATKLRKYWLIHWDELYSCHSVTMLLKFMINAFI
jgi:hypothetical protein